MAKSNHQYAVNRVSILESHAAEGHTETVHLKDQMDDMEAKMSEMEAKMEARMAEMEAKLDKIIKMLS